MPWCCNGIVKMLRRAQSKRPRQLLGLHYKDEAIKDGTYQSPPGCQSRRKHIVLAVDTSKRGVVDGVEMRKKRSLFGRSQQRQKILGLSPGR
jgi:hypothetical protein